MSDVVPFESSAQKINQKIDSEVNSIRADGDYVLPKGDAPIVNYFIQKIEGTYNVDRAKSDTDNAIDLLYIAYNTTPQREDEIRVKISGIMGKLIRTQQESESTMHDAMNVARNILGMLEVVFPDWLDVKEGNDPKEIQTFVSKDLLALAQKIRDKALSVQQALLNIADGYGIIINDTVAVTAASERALGARLRDQQAMMKEIAEANAERERLESLVKDLQEEVAKFDKKARELEKRAETAEERAFILSIVQVGAQMVAASMPAIAMALGAAATGGTSVIAASTVNSVTRKTSGSNEEGGDSEIIKTKTDISKKQAEKKASEEKTETLTKKVKELELEKAKLVSEEDEPDATDGDEDSEEKKLEPAEVRELDKRIDAAKKELKDESEKLQKIVAALEALQAALNKLEERLGKLSDEQQQQASGLRDMQMKMLDKVETYERERRAQSAELVKVNALLKGMRSDDEINQLAIKSLNLSLSALKRMREIVEEIAFFFRSFADFMGQVSSEAQQQVESYERVAEMETIRKNRLAALIESTDRFFIIQAGEWNASINVSDRFCRNFADGWSKLNKLNGTYIRDDALAAYMKTASEKLAKIVEEREAAAEQKIADLNGYRKQLAASGTA